jgi:hypothetical protein
MIKPFIAAVFCLLPALAYAEDSPLRCSTSVWGEYGSEIDCAVAVDKATIGNATINRGNCHASAGYQGEHKFGDTIVILAGCANVLEFSIEVNGETVTFSP